MPTKYKFMAFVLLICIACSLAYTHSRELFKLPFFMDEFRSFSYMSFMNYEDYISELPHLNEITNLNTLIVDEEKILANVPKELEIKTNNITVRYFKDTRSDLKLHLYGAAITNNETYFNPSFQIEGNTVNILSFNDTDHNNLVHDVRYFLDVYVPNDIQLDFNVHSQSGDIELNNGSFSNLTVYSKNGNIKGEIINSKSVLIKSESGYFKVVKLSSPLISIETTYGNTSANNIYSEHLSIRSKSGTIRCDDISSDNIELQLENGSTHLNSVHANKLDFKKNDGLLYVSKLFVDSVEIIGEAGENTIEHVRANDLFISSKSGSITIIEGHFGSLTSQTTVGRLTVDQYTGEINHKSKEGEVYLTCLNLSDQISISTTSGDVNLRFPTETHANVNYYTESGNFKTEWHPSEYQDHNTIQKTYGDGQYTVKIKTETGNLNINK